MRSLLIRASAGLVLVLSLGTLSTVLPDVLDARPECAIADEWVRVHANELPATIDELAAYPLAFRLRIYNALTPEPKAELWREQLTRALAREDLNDEQKQFIREAALPALVPAVFDGGIKHPADLEAKARKLFATHEHADIMIQIGPDSPAVRASNPEAMRLWMVTSLRSLSTLHAQTLGNCSCPATGGCWSHCAFVHPGTLCVQTPMNGGQSCEVVSSGCGFWGNCACNGACCDEHGGVCIPE